MHNFDNFQKNVKVAVLVPTPREEYATQSLTKFDRNHKNWEAEVMIPTVAPVQKPPRKRIEDSVTPQMLRDIGMNRIRKALVKKIFRFRKRRYDVLIDFPQIPPVQRFERLVDPSEIYDEYYFHWTYDDGTTKTQKHNRHTLVDIEDNVLGSVIETRRKILKQYV